MQSHSFRLFGLNCTFLAILSLVFSPFPVQAQPPAPQTKPMGQPLGESCQLADTVDPAILNPVAAFWQSAWDRTYNLGDSMALQATNAEGQWNVLLGAAGSDRWVDRGSFVEEARHPVSLGSQRIDNMYREMTDARSLDRYILAGTFVGSTGVAMPVTAMMTVLGKDDGTSFRTFSLVRVGETSEATTEFATGFARHVNGEPVEQLEVEIEVGGKSGPQHCANQCATTRTGDRSLCNVVSVACAAAATAVFVGCVAGCGAVTGGLGTPFCIAGCDLVLTAALAGCAINYGNCLDDANSDYWTCLDGCNCLGGLLFEDGRATKLIC